MGLHWANQVARSEEYHSFHRTRTHNVERALRRIGNERPSHAGNQPRTGIVDVKPTSHSQSASGDIDHLKITVGWGFFTTTRRSAIGKYYAVRDLSAAKACTHARLLEGNWIGLQNCSQVPSERAQLPKQLP